MRKAFSVDGFCQMREIAIRGDMRSGHLKLKESEMAFQNALKNEITHGESSTNEKGAADLP